MPNVIVIAGPNGAGKSTLAPVVLRELLSLDHFVNADVIARGLSAFEPQRAAFQAGRIMLDRLRELARERVDFAFETTLASRVFAPWIASLTEDGYSFRLIYVWVRSAEICITRVAQRVRAGGHYVADDIVRRRYAGGLRNFFELYRPLATRWEAYDNTSPPLRLVAEGHRAESVSVYDENAWSALLQGMSDADGQEA